MKSAVESLSQTRVRLTVEVPFAELKPDLDSAYREIGRQVRISGFRPGKVPARILDQRVGRGVVLEQAIQEAVPRLYGDALRENEVQVVGQPALEVTKLADGEELIFTAEVDVRPDIELPEYAGIEVTVDAAEVTDEEVDEQLSGLRERFATLSSVDRPVADGDYVLVDLSATVDGAEVPGSTATGMSYEVGSASLMPGLDEALLGAGEGDTRTFSSELTRGEYAGRSAEITATVRSVKVKELPELDDDFAQTASEFDTLADLRQDVRKRMEQVKLAEQGVQARDRVLDELLTRVEVPVPDALLASEIEWRQQNIDSQLSQVGMAKADYLASEGKSEQELDQEVTEAAAAAVKAQFVLEAVAGKEEVGVSEAELTDHLVRRARQLNVAPDAFARQVVQSGGLGTLASEVVRAKALALVLERAVVTDTAGRTVDLDAASAQFAAGEEFDAEGEFDEDLDEDLDAGLPEDLDAEASQDGAGEATGATGAEGPGSAAPADGPASSAAEVGATGQDGAGDAPSDSPEEARGATEPSG